MPKISQLSAGIPTTDNSEMVAVVQNGVTVKLTLAQMLALAQPFNDNLDDIGALAGDGYPFRDALGNWTLEPIAGVAGPAGPAGPAGAAGPAGPTGPAGPAGPSSYVYVATGVFDANTILDQPVNLGSFAFTKYRIQSIVLFNPSVDLSLSLVAVDLGFTAHGDELMSAMPLTGLALSDDLAQGTLLLTTKVRDETTLHLSTPILHGMAATVQYAIEIIGLD